MPSTVYIRARFSRGREASYTFCAELALPMRSVKANFSQARKNKGATES